MYYNSSSKTRSINNMKTAALIYGRNDGYKEDERLIVHLNSLLDTFDEVLYLDWNSPDHKGSLLENIRNQINKTNRLKHYVIPESIVKEITSNIHEGNPLALKPFNPDFTTRGIPQAQACIATICYNILLRRTDADWVVCTTNDIIAPKKENLNNFLNKANKNTFYTLSRRDFDIKDLQNYGFNNWEKYRDILDKTSQARHYVPGVPAKVTQNDNWSLINCCGDFQLAHRDVWKSIQGFEENMVYACYADTNIQKKAVLKGYGLEAIFDVPLYHMSHIGMGNTPGVSPSKQVYNDKWKWVENFNYSENNENWGFNNIEIEYETI